MGWTRDKKGLFASTSGITTFIYWTNIDHNTFINQGFVPLQADHDKVNNNEFKPFEARLASCPRSQSPGQFPALITGLFLRLMLCLQRQFYYETLMYFDSSFS